jgi:hypothetical protein
LTERIRNYDWYQLFRAVDAYQLQLVDSFIENFLFFSDFFSHYFNEFSIDFFLVFLRRFHQFFLVFPSNKFVQKLFHLSPLVTLYNFFDLSIDYFYVDFFNEFFHNYFLIKDSFFFDSIISHKYSAFAHKTFKNYKDVIFFEHFWKHSFFSYASIFSEDYNEKYPKPDLEEPFFDYKAYFRPLKQKFTIRFPEIFEVFKDIGFAFQDGKVREVTTFIFGNKNITPYTLLDSGHNLENANYRIFHKEYMYLVLQQFMAIYKFLFIALQRNKPVDFDLTLASYGFFNGFLYLKYNDIKKMLKLFYDLYDFSNISLFFKDFDTLTYYFLLLRFLKIKAGRNYATKLFLWDIALTLTSPKFSTKVKLVEILDPATFTFLEESFKSIKKPFSKNIKGYLFLKYLFFFISDEVEFWFRRTGENVLKPSAFWHAIFDDTPLVPEKFEEKDFTSYLRKYYSRSIHTYSSFYNISMPQATWTYTKFIPQPPATIEENYFQWKGSLKKHKKAKKLLEETMEAKWYHFNEVIRYRFFYVNPSEIKTSSADGLVKFLQLFPSHNCIVRTDEHGNIIVHVLRFDLFLKENFTLRKFLKKKEQPLILKNYGTTFFNSYKNFAFKGFSENYDSLNNLAFFEDDFFRKFRLTNKLYYKLKGNFNFLQWNNFKCRFFSDWKNKVLSLYDSDYLFFLDSLDLLNEDAEKDEFYESIIGFGDKWQPHIIEPLNKNVFDNLRSSLFWKEFLKGNVFSNTEKNTNDYNDFFFVVFPKIKKFDFYKLSWNNYFLDNLGEADFSIKTNPKFVKNTTAGLFNITNLSIIKRRRPLWYTDILDLDFEWIPGYVFSTVPYLYKDNWPFYDVDDITH